MASPEPLNEHSVQFLIKSLDRYDSFSLMFHDTLVDPENDPLNELCFRLPTLFGRSTSLETQERAIQYLVAYILNPLNSKKVTHRLFSGLVDALDSQEGLASGSGVRLVLSAMLRREDNSMKLQRVSAAEFIKPVISLLDVNNMKEILKEVVVGRLLKISGKRKRGDEESAVTRSELQSFFHLLLDSRASCVPLVVVLKEFGRHLPDKAYYDGFIRPFHGFLVQTSRVLSLLSIQHRQVYFPVIGYTLVSSPLWSLHRQSLHFLSPLGISFAAVADPPCQLVQYLIEQAHSRHTYQAVLGVTKGKYGNTSEGLEDQLVQVMLSHITGNEEATLFPLWRRISSQFIQMGLCGFVNIPSVIEKLIVELENIPSGENLTVGRNFLMWTLYQCLAVLPSPRVNDFMGCLDLCAKLYPDMEALEIPDFSSCYDVVKLGPAYLWVHIMRRAKLENVSVAWNTPFCLTHMMDFLLTAIDRAVGQPGFPGCHMKWEHAAIVNCFISMPAMKDQVVASKMDYADKMANTLMDHMMESSMPMPNSPQTMSIAASGGCVVYNATKPLSIQFLDVVSTHTRTILANTIQPAFTRIISSFRDVPGAVFLSPAFWETVARLMLYEETDNITLHYIGIKLPEIAVNKAAFVLATNFELLAFRTPYVPVSWKGNFLFMAMFMHSNLSNQQSCNAQVLIQMYQTILRMIQSFSVEDFSQPKSHLSESRLYLPESEEITRLLLLTIFRLTSIIGIDHTMLQFLNYHMNFVQQQALPHTWSQHILATFPDNVQTFYGTLPSPNRTDKKTISRLVEDAVQKLRAANTDAEIRQLFQTLQPMIMYCVIWRQLVFYSEGGDANSAPFKQPQLSAQVFDKLTLKNQMAALRVLMDYVIADVIAQATSAERIGRLCDCLSLMIWKYHILPFDRVLLVTLLRHFDVPSPALSVLVVHHLCKLPEFLSRLSETVALLPPIYWECENYFEQIVSYHQKFPEHFYFNGNFEQNGQSAAAAAVQHPRYPLYFSNVVLRCVPLFDIIVHRFIELPSTVKSFETVLELCGKIFKFHDRPVTFLWQTFHFYDNLLKDNLSIRRKLVSAVIGHKAEHFPPNFYLSKTYEAYLTAAPSTESTGMQPDYFQSLLERLIDCMYPHQAPSVYPTFEWRFHEYPNATTHALYTGCIELMSIPGGAPAVIEGLVGSLRTRIEHLTEKYATLEKKMQRFQMEVLQRWINGGALFLSALPDRYFRVLLKMLDVVISAPEMHDSQMDMIDLLDLHQVLSSNGNSAIAFICQLIHATLLHNSVNQTLLLLSHLQTVVMPSSDSINQLIFLLKLVTPLLGKISTDQDRLKQVVSDFFALVTRVAGGAQHCQDEHISLVSDALFYILDNYPVALKNDLLLQFIAGLPDQFQKRLRLLLQASGAAAF